MGGRKRPRTCAEDGGDSSSRQCKVKEEGTRRHLVIRLRHVAGRGWVCARVGSDGGDAPVAHRRGRSTSMELMRGLRTGDVGVDAMLARRRLLLVLDLDHTLLHSVPIGALCPEERYLLHQEPPRLGVPAAGGAEGSGGGSQRPLLFNLDDTIGFLTKLRPFVHVFLSEASGLFDLCICTMGDRVYAHEMARVLDPDGIYFAPEDIVSRSDFTEMGKKGLDVVRRGDERTTVILDDTAAVWEKHPDNLVPMAAYHYFAHSRRRRGCAGESLAELGEDEDERSGALATALHLLRRAHSMFFDPSTGVGAIRRP